MRGSVFCSILLFSIATSANAQLYYPPFSSDIVSPFPRYPSSQDNSSMENIEKNLKSSQANLQDQLTQINQRLQSIQGFMSAQKALKIDWVTSKNNQKISDALEVSSDGKKTQICRAKFLSGTHPGLVTSSGCLITYGGYAAFIPSYDVLVGKATTQWKSVDPVALNSYQNVTNGSTDAALWKQNSIPVQGGFENNAPLYICKATYNGVAKIGKVVGNICDVADEAKEVSVQQFEVLFGEI